MRGATVAAMSGQSGSTTMALSVTWRTAKLIEAVLEGDFSIQFLFPGMSRVHGMQHQHSGSSSATALQLLISQSTIDAPPYGVLAFALQRDFAQK